MSVVIDQFLIVPAPAAPPAPPPAEEAPPPEPSSPIKETERIIRRQVERQLRVWAH
jgi:hypothetical protein